MFDLSPMNDQKLIYLDHNATTPCAAEVLDAMLPWFRSDFGNASSVHVMGRRAAQAVAEARELVAHTIGCAEEEVVFTSGATESNNMVVLAVARSLKPPGRVVLSSIEHKSVIEPCKWLSGHGFDVSFIPVSRDGVTDVGAATDLIDDSTVLVSVQTANNEIGTLQPVSQIATIAHARGALMHTDATQALGKVPFSVDELGVDFASFSAHKVYGPKGIGALFIRRNRDVIRLEAIYRGGGQEGGLRPGTLNVPGIVGFGAACRIAISNLDDEASRIGKLRETMEHYLLEHILGSFVVGTGADRLPGTTSVCTPGVPADVLLLRNPNVCAGIGSACTSGAIEPSHVLLACDLSRDDARCCVRLSLGRYTTKEEIAIAGELLSESAGEILGMHPSGQ